MKRINDQGFSLLELIIIIAIMAVLMAVLAPQFIKYVENSREKKDEAFLEEIESAAKIACSYREVYDSLPSGDVYATVTIRDGLQVAADVPRLEEELLKTVPDIINFSSKKYQDAGSQTVNISIDAPRQIVIVTHSWN